jgi:pimeloyl-ACP methyl ester carboxylesterase
MHTVAPMTPCDDTLVLGAGPAAVVALHGIQGTRASWLGIAHALPPGVRLVLPNLRGRGRALRGSGPADYTLDRYADDAAAAIAAHVGRAPYVLAGWSLGVSVTLQLLSRGTHRPAALLLVSGSPCLSETRWFDAEGGDALALAVAARRLRLGLSEAADDDAVAHTWQALRHTDQRPLLAAAHPPAIVLHGSDDDDCPPQHAQWLADGLRAPLRLLPGVGHSLLAQAPTAVAHALHALCALPAMTTPCEPTT